MIEALLVMQGATRHKSQGNGRVAYAVSKLLGTYTCRRNFNLRAFPNLFSNRLQYPCPYQYFMPVPRTLHDKVVQIRCGLQQLEGPSIRPLALRLNEIYQDGADEIFSS